MPLPDFVADFLPLLITEEIYWINAKKDPVIISEPLLPQSIIKEEPALPIKAEKPNAPLLETPTEAIAIPSSIVKKAVVMVHYPNHETAPEPIVEAFKKIFTALGFAESDYVLLNVAKLPADTFTPRNLLILMGGSGKNLPILSQYTGSREVHYSVKIDNVSVYFARTMEAYNADQIQKAAFWQKLKTIIHS